MTYSFTRTQYVAKYFCAPPYTQIIIIKHKFTVAIRT